VGAGARVAPIERNDAKIRKWIIKESFGGQGQVTLVAEMKLATWRYRSWRAAGESPMTSDASRSARLAFCSPSAAITYGRTIFRIIRHSGGDAGLAIGFRLPWHELPGRLLPRRPSRVAVALAV
jgi:hypothetical protein